MTVLGHTLSREIFYIDSYMCTCVGEDVLKIDSLFLAMDWKNNPKEEGSVTITQKPNMV